MMTYGKGVLDQEYLAAEDGKVTGVFWWGWFISDALTFREDVIVEFLVR